MNACAPIQMQSYFETLLQFAGDGIMVHDADGTVTLVNKAFCDLLGRCEDELVGRHMFDLSPHEGTFTSTADETIVLSGDYTRYQLEQNELLFTHGRATWQLYFFHKQGTIIPVEATYCVITDERGERSGTMGIVRDITEKVRAGCATDDSRAFYENVFNTTGDGVCVTDESGYIIRVNLAFAEILGYEPNELLGRFYVELIPETIEHTEMPTDGVLFTHDYYDNFAIDYQHRDGHSVPVEGRVTTLHNRHGEATGFVFTIHDISARRKAEQQMQQSRDFLSNIFKTTGDGFLVADSEGYIVSLNTAACTMLGYSAEDLTGRHVIELSAKREYSLEKLPDIIEILFRDESVQNAEALWKRSDGSTFSVEVNLSLMKNKAGEVTGCVGAFRDITARKRAEEERIRLATVIEQATDSIVIFATNGIIVYVNPMFEETTGYRRPEALGQHISFMQHGKQNIELMRTILTTIAARERWKGTIVSRRKDRSPVTLEALFSPVLSAQGEIANYVAHLRDISQELQMEQQLRQAQKMEAIGKLAGGIAHDFNNILAAIIGYTEMTIERYGGNDDARENLRQVLHAAERAEDLIMQILTFSRQGSQHMRPIALSQVIRETCKLLRATLPSTISINQIAETDARVNANQTQMQQLLMNLCTNAAHAMRDRGGDLYIRLTEADAPPACAALKSAPVAETYLRLEVRDTGSGIPAAILDKIYDPFFTTKAVGDGTGLGLALVHGIVEDHGGIVDVQSTVGLGSTFTVFLPRTAKKSAAAKQAAAAQPGGGEHILFVDDEAFLVDVVPRMLKSLRYRVTARSSSAEALEAFRAAPGNFDLIITDQTMPQLTGIELARAALAVRPDIPVILCTGYSESISAEQARAAGIREFILKPLKRAVIAQTIRQALTPPTA